VDGNYTVTSTYNVQFIGSFPDHPWEKVWKAKVEPKYRLFFPWLLIQRKILTSDKFIRQGGQAKPCLAAMQNANGITKAPGG